MAYKKGDLRDQRILFNDSIDDYLIDPPHLGSLLLNPCTCD